MARALELAARGLYTTTPNPRVGCVIVRDGVVIGEGFHERAGEAHAEVNALADAARRGADPRGATMYVTLEPCNTHGRRPPCVDAVLAAGIARVVAAMADPNPRKAGGAQRLRAAGIAVELGLSEDAARELNPGFLSLLERGRPWVRTKLATSLDGRTRAHQRAESVDHRARGARRRPRVARPRLRDPHRHRHRAAGRSADECARGGNDTAAAPRDRRPAWADAGLGAHSRRRRCPDRDRGRAQSRVAAEAWKRCRCPTRKDGSILRRCSKRSPSASILELHVEAGAKLNGALLDAGLIDEILLYVAPSVLGDPARGMFERAPPLAALADRTEFAFHDVQRVGSDLRIVARRVASGERLMFTGIVQMVGRITAATARADGLRLAVDTGVHEIGDVAVGDSVAVDGCCLTVVEITGATLQFDVSAETLRCTTGLDRTGDVNLELALRLGDRVGGHLMSGHVDGVGTVTSFDAIDGDAHGSFRLVIAAPAELGRFIAPKGLDRRRRREPHRQ